MSAKQIVSDFYNLDLAKSKEALSFFHEDCEIYWNSTKGQSVHKISHVKELLKELQRNYHSYEAKVTHLLEEDGVVTARYTIYVTPIERPEKEDALAHFITIWELKDGKLFKGYQISQLADNNTVNMISF